MADKKVTQYTELTSVAYGDIAYIVDDPGGTPISKKCTAQNLVKGAVTEGALAGLADAALTVDRALQSSAAGVIEASSVTSTELGYVSGVTSGIQTQINGKSSTSHNHDGTYNKWRGELASAPGSASTGDMYYNTGDSKVYIYVNSAWAALN